MTKEEEKQLVLDVMDELHPDMFTDHELRWIKEALNEKLNKD